VTIRDAQPRTLKLEIPQGLSRVVAGAGVGLADLQERDWSRVWNRAWRIAVHPELRYEWTEYLVCDQRRGARPRRTRSKKLKLSVFYSQWHARYRAWR